MKKLLLLIGGIGLLAVLVVVFFRMRPSSSPKQVEGKKNRIVQPVNVIPQKERPYLAISPFADGKNIDIVVNTLPKTASEVEYELEYQAGTLLQGAFGAINLDKLPAHKKILLGSCSAGGACTYHKDVKGGSLVMNFSGKNNYSLKTEWKYIDNIAKEKSFSSRDGKFQITSDKLAKVRYLIISQASGIPEGYKGKIASEPYSLELGSRAVGDAKISIRSNTEEPLTVIGWNGSKWEDFATTQDGKLATASVPLLPLYVAVTQ